MHTNTHHKPSVCHVSSDSVCSTGLALLTMLALRRHVTPLSKVVVTRSCGSVPAKTFPCLKPKSEVKDKQRFVYNMRKSQVYDDGKVTYENGMTLEGEFREGKLWTGNGTLFLPSSGSTFVGSYFEGKPHGEGTLTHSDGRMMQGEWKEGVLMNGSGILRKRGNYMYVGDFFNGLRHGQGKWTSKNGNMYDGEWVAGKQHGEGVYTNADGTELRGEFRNGHIYNGEGFLRLNVTIVIEGTFVDGVWQNGGKIIYPDKSFYIGENLNFKPHGQGTLQYPTGQTLTGEWKHGKIYNVTGTYILKDGNVLQGTWVNGVNDKVPLKPPAPPSDGSSYKGGIVNYLYHGKGVLTNYDGSILSGEFREGKIYKGKGAMIDEHGRKIVGSWKNGVLLGRTTLLNTDGSIFVGKLEGTTGEKCGERGKLTYPDGAVYVGEWANGKPHGSGKFLSRTGDGYEGAYVAGKRHGQGKQVLTTGIVYEGEWVNNLYHGMGFLFSKCGRLSVQAEFRHGKIYTGMGRIPIGETGGASAVFSWHQGRRQSTSGAQKGQEKMEDVPLNYDYEGVFEEGNLIHGKVVNVDGSEYLGDLRDGKSHGMGRRTYRNGDVYEGGWSAGLRHGQGKLAYSDGSTLQGEFRDGKIYTGSGARQSKAGNIQQGNWINGVLQDYSNPN